MTNSDNAKPEWIGRQPHITYRRICPCMLCAADRAAKSTPKNEGKENV